MRSGTNSGAGRGLGCGFDKASPLALTAFFPATDSQEYWNPTSDSQKFGKNINAFKEFVNYRGGAYRVTRYTGAGTTGFFAAGPDGR